MAIRLLGGLLADLALLWDVAAGAIDAHFAAVPPVASVAAALESVAEAAAVLLAAAHLVAALLAALPLLTALLALSGLPPASLLTFSLLALLVENRERLVSRDEVLEKVWDGRIVSEAAVASRVKSARQALGDDGKAQRLIRTVHGQGFRFVGEVHAAVDLLPPSEPPARPSIAVLPFRLLGVPGRYGAIADALPHDLISELARLRWLFVTARGSSLS